MIHENLVKLGIVKNKKFTTAELKEIFLESKPGMISSGGPLR